MKLFAGILNVFDNALSELRTLKLFQVFLNVFDNALSELRKLTLFAGVLNVFDNALSELRTSWIDDQNEILGLMIRMSFLD